MKCHDLLLRFIQQPETMRPVSTDNLSLLTSLLKDLEIVGMTEADFLSRSITPPLISPDHFGLGRELFGSFRACVASASEGGFSFGAEWFEGKTL